MTATTAAFVALPRRCQAATAYLVGDFVRKAPANNDMPRRAKLLVHLVLDHLQSIHTRCQRTGFTVGACRKQAPGDDTWLYMAVHGCYSLRGLWPPAVLSPVVAPAQHSVVMLYGQGSTLCRGQQLAGAQACCTLCTAPT